MAPSSRAPQCPHTPNKYGKVLKDATGTAGTVTTFFPSSHFSTTEPWPTTTSTNVTPLRLAHDRLNYEAYGSDLHLRHTHSSTSSLLSQGTSTCAKCASPVVQRHSSVSSIDQYPSPIKLGQAVPRSVQAHSHLGELGPNQQTDSQRAPGVEPFHTRHPPLTRFCTCSRPMILQRAFLLSYPLMATDALIDSGASKKTWPTTWHPWPLTSNEA